MKETELKDLKTLLYTFFGEGRATAIMGHPKFDEERDKLTQALKSLDAVSHIGALFSKAVILAEELGAYNQATGLDSKYMRNQLEEIDRQQSSLIVTASETFFDRVRDFESVRGLGDWCRK